MRGNGSRRQQTLNDLTQKAPQHTSVLAVGLGPDNREIPIVLSGKVYLALCRDNGTVHGGAPLFHQDGDRKVITSDGAKYLRRNFDVDCVRDMISINYYRA